MRRIVLAEITQTKNGVEVNGTVAYELTPFEEAMFGRELERQGFLKVNKQAVKELMRDCATKREATAFVDHL